MALIPVLILIGAGLKHLTGADNKWIPLILGILSVLLCTLYTLCQTAFYAVWTDVLTVILTGIVQGVLCAGAAVYGNQLYKQLSSGEK